MAFLRKKELEWLERMDVTAQPGHFTGSTTTKLQSEGETSNDVEGESEEVDPEDDFKREMHL